jgi:CBS-domain-containing membrane protein
MKARFSPIPSRAMPAGTVVRDPRREAPPAVTPDDPAVSVMTDLARVPAVPVDPEVSIESAMRVMVRRGVRSLFVIDIENRVVGLITATDLLGEKPLRHMHAHGGSRGEIRVRDLMTPQAQLEVLSMADVSRARVGDVLATLKAVGRQHAMVVEAESGGAVVRGVFSASQLEIQLGEPVVVAPVARTFAEIEAALAHG